MQGPLPRVRGGPGQQGGQQSGARDVEAGVGVGHGRGQSRAGGTGFELEIGDERDGPDDVRRIEAHRPGALDRALQAHPRDGGAPQHGGGDVVGVPLHLRSDVEDLVGGEHRRVADQGAGRDHPGDDGTGGGSQPPRMGDPVRAVHADADLGGAHAVERQAQGAHDQVVVALLHVVGALPLDDDRGRPGRRVDLDLVPQVQRHPHGVESGSQVRCRRGHRHRDVVLVHPHLSRPPRGWPRRPRARRRSGQGRARPRADPPRAPGGW